MATEGRTPKFRGKKGEKKRERKPRITIVRRKTANQFLMRFIKKSGSKPKTSEGETVKRKRQRSPSTPPQKV